jgi:linoleoyl-CoA desaturase
MLPQPIHIPEAGTAIDPCLPLKFSDRSEFLSVLRQRVDDYFCTTGQPRRDCPQMYVKTVVIVSWLATSYVMLVFLSSTWWQAIPLAISTGLAMAAVGFNIQHDGGHRAYSDYPWVNKLAALTLDLLGGSSYVWDRKHNSIHHTYPNITGYDDDINIGFLGRLSPHQRHLKFHRLQHFYLWFLFGFMTIKWQVYDDFRDVLKGQIDGHRFVRPAGWNRIVFIVGKLVFFSLALVIPMLLCEFSAVLFCYVLAAFVQGVTLSVVFQLAHCVEDASFPVPDLGTGRIENDWAVHQVEATVNFATRNRFVAWLTGGLNFQIEHHLFPRICHVNYPAISRLVEETCREFEIEYVVHETLFAGVASHFRWLRRMGMPEAA